jgi:hypothetical protein
MDGREEIDRQYLIEKLMTMLQNQMLTPKIIEGEGGEISFLLTERSEPVRPRIRGEIEQLIR